MEVAPPPPRRQRGAPQLGEVTTAQVAEGEEEVLSDEEMAALLEVELERGDGGVRLSAGCGRLFFFLLFSSFSFV